MPVATIVPPSHGPKRQSRCIDAASPVPVSSTAQTSEEIVSRTS
jgi:hypothetical protein